MTVHMFRPYIGLGDMSRTDLESQINTWKQEHTRWSGDSMNHSLREYRDADGNLICHTLDIRFEQTDTKANILQKLVDKIENKCQWYRVGYHACSHDEETPHACSWDDVAEWTAKDVTVPSDVPSFQ